MESVFLRENEQTISQYVTTTLLLDSGEGTKPQPLLTQLTSPETLAEVNPEGNRFYVIPAIETAVTNRLGLIITRLDAQESSDPKGAYTIVLYPGP